MDRLTGIHAVREALEAGRAFDRIVIARGRQDTRVEEIVKLARRNNIAVRFEDRGQLDRLADSKDHQGVVALAAARAAATLEDILAVANAGPGKGEKGLIVCWMAWRTRTIWEPSCVPRMRRALPPS